MNKTKVKEELLKPFENYNELYNNMVTINEEPTDRFDHKKYSEILLMQMYLYHVKKGIHTIYPGQYIPEIMPKDISYDEFIDGLEKYKEIEYFNDTLKQNKNYYSKIIFLSEKKLLGSVSWARVFSEEITGEEPKIDGKIYISVDNEDLYYFAYLLLIKCLRDDILDYTFKANYDRWINRTDNLVIYVNKDNINKYLSIINEIKHDYPEFKFNYSQIIGYELSEGVAIGKDYKRDGNSISFTDMICASLTQMKKDGNDINEIIDGVDAAIEKRIGSLLSVMDDKYKPKKIEEKKEEISEEETYEYKTRSPYNAGLPKDISNLSREEQLKEIKLFAEGSKELENCLIAAYENGLTTYASCKGYHDYTIEDYYNYNIYALATCMTGPYVSFTTDQILDYLTDDFINNQAVEINQNIDGNVSIYFYGKNSYNLLKELTNCIKTGRKRDGKTDKLLTDRLNKKPDPKDVYEAYTYGFKKSGIFEIGVEEIEEFIKKTAILNASLLSKDPIETAYRLFPISGISEDDQKMVLEDIEKRKQEIEENRQM